MYLSSKNDAIAKKYFGFTWANRKKAGLKRIRSAKKTHSSLLAMRDSSYTNFPASEVCSFPAHHLLTSSPTLELAGF